MGRDFVKHVGRYFVPTTVELIAVGLFVFSICMYFVAILFVYDETTVDSMVSLQADIKDSLQTFVANPYVDVVWHGVFWFIAGAVGLSVLWGLAVLFIDIRNDMVISSNFVHPKSFHHADIWVASIARLVVRVAFVAGGGLFAIRLAMLLPYVYDLVRYAAVSIQTPHVWQDAGMALLASLLWILGLHIVFAAIAIRRHAGAGYSE